MPGENVSAASETRRDHEPFIALDSQTIGLGQQPGAGVVTEKHLLFFGSTVLAALAVLMVLASLTYFISDKDHLQIGKDIFDFAKATLPPIATLILGFYFRGRTGN